MTTKRMPIAPCAVCGRDWPHSTDLHVHPSIPPRTPTTQYEPCGKFGCTTPHKPHVAPRCGTCGIPDHYAGDNRHDCGAPDPAPHAPCHEGCDMCAVLDALDAPDPAPLDAHCPCPEHEWAGLMGGGCPCADEAHVAHGYDAKEPQP